MKENETIKLIVREHVLMIIKIARLLGWSEINESMIHWSLYLVHILHLFSEEKPFYDKVYTFIIEEENQNVLDIGPKCNLITDSIQWLLLNKYISEDNNSYCISDLGNELLENPIDQFDYEWIELVINLESMYGESKLLNYIFLDQEFRIKYYSQLTDLEVSNSENETIKFLKEFQNVFDKNKSPDKELSKKEYLVLYFDYLFSRIIKNEEE